MMVSVRLTPEAKAALIRQHLDDGVPLTRLAAAAGLTGLHAAALGRQLPHLLQVRASAQIEQLAPRWSARCGIRPPHWFARRRRVSPIAQARSEPVSLANTTMLSR